MIERLVQGEVPAKHHIVMRSADGNLRYEECLTRTGFEGPYTIAYHLRRPHVHSPVATAHGWEAPAPSSDAALLRRHYRTSDLEDSRLAPIDARVPLLFNRDITISVARPGAADPVYFVNGDGDDLYYMFRGSGTLRTILGDIRYQEDDYVYVPKGLIHRFIPDDGEQYWLSMETAGIIDVPKQWRNPVGQLRMDAPYCHRDFRHPEFRGPMDEDIRDVVVKRGGAFFGYRYDDSPLDVVGWDGTVYPFAFAILDFQPRAGLVHLPPTWHGTFAARGLLICSFVPRMVDFHPDAIPCPYPHSSVDCDEFLFYCRGNFTSRRGVGPGSVSYHPAGIAHGPHAGAYEASIGERSTSELAVMVDTYEPMVPTARAAAIEVAGYHDSFA